jgi:cell division septal protein FtsQ
MRWRLPRPSVPRWSGRLRRGALVALVLAAMAAGGWWLYRSPLLSVHDVTVEGNVVLSPEVVRSIADIEGRSIARPDFQGARQRLLALPVVKDVRIERDWPNGARISIAERVPWGVWQIGDGRFVIDQEGVVLDLPAPEGAPLIVQTDAAQTVVAPGDRVDPGAVALARELLSTAERTVGRSVVGLEFSQASGVTAVLSDDLRVAFGDVQGYEFKVAALFAVLQQAAEEGRTLRRVDLRFGDRVAVQ